MITRVEISGFKTFTDFSVDLAPLSVIAGANASGKSNFLDALRIVQGITAGKSLDNILDGRGNASHFFTKFDEHKKSTVMSIAVELLLPLVTTGKSAGEQLEGNRFRYEMRITEDQEHFEPYQVDFEKLTFIDEAEDTWSKTHVATDQLDKVVRYRTDSAKELLFRGIETVDGETRFGHVSDQQGRSALSNINGEENIHTRAVRQDLINIEYVSLYDADNFSNFYNRKDNKSLVLKELIKLAGENDLERRFFTMRVSAIAKSIKDIDLEVDSFSRLTLTAKDTSGARHLSDSLSEGTLRTIALAALLFSKAPQRIILIEEPENGIDPRVLNQVVELISDLATDLSGDGGVFIQVICTTHSPIVVDRIVEEGAPTHATAYLAYVSNKGVEFNSERFFASATSIYPIVRNIDLPVAESRRERATLHEAKEYLSQGYSKSLVDA